MEESTSFVTTVTFTPEESFLILCQTGEGEMMSGACLGKARRNKALEISKKMNAARKHVQ